MENLKTSISTYLQFEGYDVFSELSFISAKKSDARIASTDPSG
jgi:hypothetical protein